MSAASLAKSVSMLRRSCADVSISAFRSESVSDRGESCMLCRASRVSVSSCICLCMSGVAVWYVIFDS